MLTGFREWLTAKLDADRPEFAWPGQGVMAAFSAPVAVESMTPEQDALARETLFRLLDEFLVERSRPDGLMTVFVEVASWKAARQRGS